MTRLYIPESYVDEICPPGRTSPSEWIAGPAGDRWRLAPCDEHDPDEPPVMIAPGELVAFSWLEHYLALWVRIAADGRFTTDEPPHPGANAFWLPGDPDKLRRRGIGIELSPRYFTEAIRYVEAAAREMAIPSLFDLMGGPESALGRDDDEPVPAELMTGAA